MGMRSKIITGALASALSLSGGAVLAQEATPDATPAVGEAITVNFENVDGDVIGSASFAETGTGVSITVQSTSEGDGSGLEPGLHGIHIHETGECDASGETPFESAGDHFNPTDASHGGLEDEDSHAGDLGNLEVDDAGTFGLNITTDKVTLEPGAETSLADADGSAILIHADEDDLETDPSGESGDRVACAVIFPPEGAGATPASDATPEATPLG